MNNREADQYVRNLEYKQSWFNCTKRIKNDPKINDVRLTDKSFEEILDETNMIPHPFLIQCIWPGCTRHFKNQDELKKHLSEEHSVGQDELNNHEIYALMLMYDNSEKCYVKGHTKRYAQVLQYWQKKRCLFQHCNYRFHNALNNGLDYIRYFKKEILYFDFINDTQVRIIDALSSAWKVLFKNRLYHIVQWKAMTPAMIFRSRNGVLYTDVNDREETYIINPEPENNEEGENLFEPWDEFED
jgi:hypothetical protein